MNDLINKTDYVIFDRYMSVKFEVGRSPRRTKLVVLVLDDDGKELDRWSVWVDPKRTSWGM
ncbi:MAG: hypothetical protein NUV78_01415 [Candidatus Zambryskibacteria bacterium]|nr:hypothetical protein [Candidatus Zambryskibacteria bacterium]